MHDEKAEQPKKGGLYQLDDEHILLSDKPRMSLQEATSLPIPLQYQGFCHSCLLEQASSPLSAGFERAVLDEAMTHLFKLTLASLADLCEQIQGRTMRWRRDICTKKRRDSSRGRHVTRSKILETDNMFSRE